MKIKNLKKYRLSIIYENYLDHIIEHDQLIDSIDDEITQFNYQFILKNIDKIEYNEIIASDNTRKRIKRFKIYGKKYKEFIKQTNLLMYYFYNIKEQHRLIYNLIQLEDVLKTDTFFDLKRKKQLKEELININNKKINLKNYSMISL